MSFLPLEDVTLYYEVQGEGIPLVFIHGMSLSHVTWQPQVNYFKRLGYQTITLDIRGHGRTSATHRKYKHGDIITQITKDVRALLNFLNIDRAIFIGYSTGSVICQQFADMYPECVSGMVLSGAFPKIINSFLYLKFVLPMGLIRLGIKRPLIKGVARANGKDEDQIQAFQQEAKKVNKREALRLLRACLTFDKRDALRNLSCPILVIYGGNERHMMVYRRAYLRYAPTAEVCLIPNVNHATLTKKTEDYNRVILHFFNEIKTRHPLFF
ncbi:alpha/beta fold hydrolase [Caldalkalibacillus salinus]|uniref:alpha/beta fold hydrolase n=1 Tax=Caldalkalibacillus salinus TaxID=2803787 RepID=UPI0019231E1E|nr:alpha/beta hydrolase [Caldalkalibacillus salinus]